MRHSRASNLSAVLVLVLEVVVLWDVLSVWLPLPSVQLDFSCSAERVGLHLLVMLSSVVSRVASVGFSFSRSCRVVDLVFSSGLVLVLVSVPPVCAVTFHTPLFGTEK